MKNERSARRDELLCPSGWCQTQLGAIAAKLVDGSHNPPQPSANGSPMLSARNIEDGQINWNEAFRNLNETDFAFENQRTNVTPGDVLLTIVGSIGRSLVVPAEAGPFTLQRSVAVVSVPECVPRFLSYQFRGPRFSEFLRRSSRGTAQKGVYLKSLAQAPLLLAPVLEQRAVAAALDSYLSRLDEAAAALERVQRNLKRYRAAVLQAAVEGRLVPTQAALARAEGRTYERASELLQRILAERRGSWEEVVLARLKATGKAPKEHKWAAQDKEGPLVNANALSRLPEGWCWASVAQLGDVSGGLTKNARRGALEQRLPYLRVANVYADELRLEDLQTIGVADSEIQRTLLHSGDLLVVEGNGSIDQIGRVAVWDRSIHPCLHQNHIIKVRFSLPTMSTWVLCWLLSPQGRDQIQRVASSTSGLHTLSLSKVGSLPVPVPPLAEQSRIQAEVDRCLTVISALAKTTETAEQRLARLRRAVLKWAFEGKLIDQDPNDEPAAMLLERIRAERATQAKNNGKRAGVARNL